MLSRRSFLKACVSTLTAFSGLEMLGTPIASSAVYRQIPILAYHRVGYTEGCLTVTPERFTNDLVSLQSRGYCSITLEYLQKYLYSNSLQMPDKPILITFDDGYLDNYQYAYPILKSRGMVGTFFIITDMLWSKDRLSVQNICEMSSGGMSFGSHTVTHRALGSLSAVEVNDELENSKTTLESALGRQITAIAYPRGSYNSGVIDIAKRNGYNLAFTVNEGVCTRDTSRLAINRIPIFKYDDNVLNILDYRGYS